MRLRFHGISFVNSWRPFIERQKNPRRKRINSVSENKSNIIIIIHTKDVFVISDQEKVMVEQ